MVFIISFHTEAILDAGMLSSRIIMFLTFTSSSREVLYSGNFRKCHNLVFVFMEITTLSASLIVLSSSSARSIIAFLTESEGRIGVRQPTLLAGELINVPQLVPTAPAGAPARVGANGGMDCKACRTLAGAFTVGWGTAGCDDFVRLLYASLQATFWPSSSVCCWLLFRFLPVPFAAAFLRLLLVLLLSGLDIFVAVVPAIS